MFSKLFKALKIMQRHANACPQKNQNNGTVYPAPTKDESFTRRIAFAKNKLRQLNCVIIKKEVKDDNRKGSYTIETDYQRPR